LCCLPFIGWKAYVYSKSHVTYPATLTFMIDDGSGGGFNIGGLLSSLGAGGEKVGEFDKILALSKSMRIVSEVMLTKATLGGVEDFMGNHLIRVEQINEEFWSKKPAKPGLPSLNGFLFTRDSFDQFSRLEYSAMKYMGGVLNGNEERVGIFSVGYNEDTGIITYKVSCRTEEMSILLLNTFYEKLSAFYVEKTIGKNNVTYGLVKAKADSIKRVLNSIEYKQAKFEDASHSILLNADKVPSQRYMRDKQLLTLMYAEASKNLELADFALKSSTPYIQILDKAVPPLDPEPISRLKLLLTAIALGVAVSVTIIIGRKIIKDSL
jgi:hypothetical protein